MPDICLLGEFLSTHKLIGPLLACSILALIPVLNLLIIPLMAIYTCLIFAIGFSLLPRAPSDKLNAAISKLFNLEIGTQLIFLLLTS